MYAQNSPKLDPHSPLYAIVRIWLDPSPPPLCVVTIKDVKLSNILGTMWMTPIGFIIKIEEHVAKRLVLEFYSL